LHFLDLGKNKVSLCVERTVVQRSGDCKCGEARAALKKETRDESRESREKSEKRKERDER
jgi:hypothetical protein